MNHTYKTDGIIVINKEGDCMGIFSTVSLLNDKIREIETLRSQLKDAKETIGFYAESCNWRSLSHSRDVIHQDDKDELDGCNYKTGGKKAREYQSKYLENK